MYRLGVDGRINWHFLVTDWNYVRLQLLGEAPGLPATSTRRAVQAELKAQIMIVPGMTTGERFEPPGGYGS